MYIIKKEQTDSNQRVGRRGVTGVKKEKGHQGTCIIKDPWTNQSGVGLRVGGGLSGVEESVGGEMETAVLAQC